MQKTMIKSILAVAVAGAFSATAFAALPTVANGFGFASVTKIDENFSTLDATKADKAAFDALNNKVTDAVTDLDSKVSQEVFNQKISEITDLNTGLIHNMAYSAADINQATK